MLSGVYSITCKSTGKGYLGSSIDIAYRWKRHLYLLRKGVHTNPHLQNSFDKYGESNFEFRLIEDLSGLTREEILYQEQVYLDIMNLKNSFNVCLDARGGKVSDEANERRKESLRKFHKENPEALRGENNPFYGRSHSPASKEAVSKANLGRVRSEEFKRLKSEFMSNRRGKHHTESHRNKLREKYSGGGNPSAVSVTVNGIFYETKKEAIKALGLKYHYQLDKLLKA